MHAAWYENFGAAKDVVQTGELEVPAPQAGEVLVKVAYSGINPVDVKRRAGGRGGTMDSKVIPHFDGAGVIEGVGDGVDSARVNERVWLFEAQWLRPGGTAAEYTCVPADRAAPLPDSTGFDEGACLGIPALTAHRCVFGDGSVKGKTVLVTGGAGAVGNYAIQFAHLGGANVITTVSGDEKAAMAVKAGADHVINYHAENVAEAVGRITEGNGVDRIVEVAFGVNLETSIAVLKNNGVIASYASDTVQEPQVPFYQMLYKNVVVRHELVFIMPEDAKQLAISDISRWLAEGRLHHSINRSFLLEDIAAAHEAVEAGAMGKILINVAES